MSSACLPHLYIRRFDPEGDSNLMLYMNQCRLDISRSTGGFKGVGFPGAGYDVGSKFARGWISVVAVTVVCLGLTTDKMEAERAELLLHTWPSVEEEVTCPTGLLLYSSKMSRQQPWHKPHPVLLTHMPVISVGGLWAMWQGCRWLPV